MMDFRYENGELMKKGDRIWWNSSLVSGYIHQFLDLKTAESRGLEEETLVIALYTPYKNRKSGIYITTCPKRLIYELGVEKMTIKEEELLDLIIKKSKEKFGYPDDCGCYLHQFYDDGKSRYLQYFIVMKGLEVIGVHHEDEF